MPINHNYEEVWLSDKMERIIRLYPKEYLKYRKDWVELPRNFLHSPAPLHVSFESTTSCNLKCPMCSRTKRIKEGGIGRSGNIPFDKYKELIEHCGQIGVKAVKLNAGATGEPLILKDIVDRIKLAKNNGIVDVMLNTNATMLSKELGKSLIEAGLDKLIISFDSPYKEEYEAIRFGAKFEEVFYKIYSFCLLKDAMRVAFPLVRIQIITNPHVEDYKKIQDIIEMWRRYVDVIAVLTKVDYEFCEKRPEVDYFRSIKDKGINVGMVCSMLWQRMSVYTDGKIIPCCGDELGLLPVGHIEHNTISGAWNSQKLRDIRATHIRGDIFSLESCRACGVYENYLRNIMAEQGSPLPNVHKRK